MKKKKLIGAVAAIVMSATCAAGLAACGGGNDDHSHSWQYRDIGGGYHRQECSCGAVTEREEHKDVDEDNFCDDCHVDLSTVVAVTSVTLDQTSATMTAGGETLTLTATVNPVGAATVIWTSSDNTVATVVGGVVTPLKAGAATITAAAGDKSATCEIVVNVAPPAQAVEMDEEKWEAALTFGDKVGATSTMTSAKGTSVSTIKFDGKKVYMYGNSEGVTYESYVEVTAEGDAYEYSKGYEYWTKEKNTEGLTIEYLKARYLSLAAIFPFEKFEQGTVNGEYVAKEAYSVTVETVGGNQIQNVKSAALHFDGNGKLVSGEYLIDGKNGEEHYYATFDYNPTVNLPAILLSGQVTDEEWNAALTMNFTNYRVGVSAYGMVLNEFKFDGNKRFTSYGTFGDAGITKDETYYAKESDGVYAYKTEHGRTTKELTTLTDSQYAGLNAIQFFEIDPADYVKSNFTFDEENKMYVATIDGGMSYVMFKGGKLVWARRVTYYDDYTIDFVYGDTNIVIPTVNTVGGQVTGDEWTAALAMSDAKISMEADLIYKYFGKVAEILGRKDGDKLYQKNTTSDHVLELYTDKEGDKYYGYSVSGGVWVKEEIEAKDYAQYLPSSMLEGLNMSDFEWNAATQSYTPKAGGRISEIRFVNNKVDYVVMQPASNYIQKIYFSYGTAAVTIPTAGDKADSDDYPGSEGGGSSGVDKPGGGGGDDVEVKPSIDIDEKEWGGIFEDVYACPSLSVQVYAGDPIQYNFDDQISIRNENTNEITIYAVVDGTLKKVVMVEGEPVEQKCEFDTPEQAKYELIERFFIIEGRGNIVKLYSQFQGNNGQYQCSEGSNYIVVMVQDGKLTTITYGNSESNVMIQFNYPQVEGSQGAEKN